MDALLRRRLMMLGGGGPTPPPSPLPPGAIPCELIYSSGYSAFIDTSLIPSPTMSFEADVCWVKPNNVLQSIFGYMIDGVRYAPITRETYLEVQYNNWYNTTYQIGNGIFRCKHKAVVTPTGTTIETYSPDGVTLLNTSSVTYSESVTFTKAIGLLGRKNTVSSIAEGTFRGGLGRLKCYGDDHFGTLVADFFPCYYNNNFGFWETEGEAMHIGTTPSDILGFGEAFNTAGFYPNTRQGGQGVLADWRLWVTSDMYEIPSGCTQIRFNAGTVSSSDNHQLTLFKSDKSYQTYYNYISADRVVSVSSAAKYVRMSMTRGAENNCYIYDVTNSKYIWKGINVT